jgi:hypothetical protein
MLMRSQMNVRRGHMVLGSREFIEVSPFVRFVAPDPTARVARLRLFDRCGQSREGSPGDERQLAVPKEI